MNRILIVEDEQRLARFLKKGLRSHSLSTTAVEDGDSALRLLRSEDFDLVVLDLGLPDMDGTRVLEELRASGSKVPVIILTARDDMADKVTGLTVGGDDYVTKPFSLEEVVARIRAILRRTHPEDESDAVLRYADLELDEESHEVRRAGRVVDLSPTEFKLLRYLMINAGRVLSKSLILDHVWEYDWGGDGAIVESYISYLRRKIDGRGTADGEPPAPLIHTRRGIGYLLRLPPES